MYMVSYVQTKDDIEVSGWLYGLPKLLEFTKVCQLEDLSSAPTMAGQPSNKVFIVRLLYSHHNKLFFFFYTKMDRELAR